jgi:hypothetical protein
MRLYLSEFYLSEGLFIIALRWRDSEPGARDGRCHETVEWL